MTRSVYPASQYFGFQNPYNNPEMMTYFARPTLMAGIGNLPASAATPGTGPIGNRTGQDYDFLEEGTQGPADPSGSVNKEPSSDSEGPVVDERQNKEGGDKEMIDDYMDRIFGRLDKLDDPDLLRRKLEATEDFFVRRAQLNQKMGLENLEAAGKAAFNYKYAPQMFMTAAASRAAYYPEMVRAASESFTGLNLANAAKPRMSGYFRGIV
jgi:hypothetical protein